MVKIKEEIPKRDLKNISLTILVAFAIVSFWRGIWGLSDIYIFPNNYELSLWISLIISLIILVLTKSLLRKLI